MKNSTAEEFVSLVFAPSSNITAVGSLLVEETLSFGSVHLVDPNCTSDLVVFVRIFHSSVFLCGLGLHLICECGAQPNYFVQHWRGWRKMFCVESSLGQNFYLLSTPPRGVQVEQQARL